MPSADPETPLSMRQTSSGISMHIKHQNIIANCCAPEGEPTKAEYLVESNVTLKTPLPAITPRHCGRHPAIRHWRWRAYPEIYHSMRQTRHAIPGASAEKSERTVGGADFPARVETSIPCRKPHADTTDCPPENGIPAKPRRHCRTCSESVLPASPGASESTANHSESSLAIPDTAAASTARCEKSTYFFTG